MIKIAIPGFRTLNLAHLVLDYNGTIAHDGKLISGIKEQLEKLSQNLEVHIITADTFGDAASHIEGIPCKLRVISPIGQDRKKLNFIKELGVKSVVSIGNGRNDYLMFKRAALSIAVIQEEGAYIRTVLSADIACRSIGEALGLLLNTPRLIATLRN